MSQVESSGDDTKTEPVNVGLDKAEEARLISIRKKEMERSEKLLAHKADENFRAAMKALDFDSAAQREEEIERIEKASLVFNKIVGDYPATIGKAVSMKERETMSSANCTLVYGEIHFKTFAIVLAKIKRKYGALKEGSGGAFVDIGSGSGKAVFAAMLLHEFEKVIGVEILHGLHRLSLEMLDLWQVKKHALDVSEKTRETEIELLQGDALEFDWTACMFGFANSTCFTEELMQSIADQAERMPTGAVFVTFTRQLPR